MKNMAESVFSDILECRVVASSICVVSNKYVLAAAAFGNNKSQKVEFFEKKTVLRSFTDVVELDRYIAGELKQSALELIVSKEEYDFNNVILNIIEGAFEVNDRKFERNLQNIYVFVKDANKFNCSFNKSEDHTPDIGSCMFDPLGIKLIEADVLDDDDVLVVFGNKSVTCYTNEVESKIGILITPESGYDQMKNYNIFWAILK